MVSLASFYPMSNLCLIHIVMSINSELYGWFQVSLGACIVSFPIKKGVMTCFKVLYLHCNYKFLISSTPFD